MAVPIAAQTYRQPVVLVCGDAQHRYSENPLRQVAGGLYLHVADEEQLIRQAEVLLATARSYVACTVVPVVHLDMAVLAGRLRRFVGGLATVPQGGKCRCCCGAGCPAQGERMIYRGLSAPAAVQVTPAGESSDSGTARNRWEACGFAIFCGWKA